MKRIAHFEHFDVLKRPRLFFKNNSFKRHIDDPFIPFKKVRLDFYDHVRIDRRNLIYHPILFF